MWTRDEVRELLSGGDRRSIGRAAEAVGGVESGLAAVADLVALMRDPDPVVAMRAADTLEKATAACPERLQPFSDELLSLAAGARQPEVRWHLAQIVPRLALDHGGRAVASRVLGAYLADQSSIVRAFALQAVADLAEADAGLMAEVRPVLERALDSGTPAMRARARRLLQRLDRGPDGRRG